MIVSIRKDYLALLKEPRTNTVQLQERLDEIDKNKPEALDNLQPETDRYFLNFNIPANKNADNYYNNLGKLENYNFSRERIEYLIKAREHLKKLGAIGFVSPVSSPNRESPNSVMVNYTPSDNLRQFVQKGDLPTIRTALRMELNDNSLTSADLEAAMAWTQRRVPGLFEPFLEKIFARGMNTDQKLWTSQYYDSQTVYLKTNYSAERFSHLIQVRSLLRQQGVEGFAPLPPIPSRSAGTSTHAHSDTSQISGRYRHAGTTGYVSATQQNSSEWSCVPFKVFLIIGCSLAAAVVVLMRFLMNQNS